jgi:hypothetical protein
MRIFLQASISPLDSRSLSDKKGGDWHQEETPHTAILSSPGIGPERSQQNYLVTVGPRLGYAGISLALRHWRTGLATSIFRKAYTISRIRVRASSAKKHRPTSAGWLVAVCNTPSASTGAQECNINTLISGMRISMLGSRIVRIFLPITTPVD